MTFRRSIPVLLLAVAASTVMAHAQQSDALRAQRLLVVDTVMQEQANKLSQQMTHDQSKIATRDLANAALFTLRANGSSMVAEAYLRRIFALQIMDSASKEFGTIPWDIGDSSVKDANSIEFNMQPMGAIVLGYGDRLSPVFKKEAQPHLLAALAALANHQVKVSYTNIFLMNTMNTIELAEYLGDKDALARGYKQWQAWWEYTQQNGVHEFDSPTYYAVDLGDLNLGFLYVRDAAIHQQIKLALNMLWRDIASNYLIAGAHLAGAHSRDYNLLSGHGGVEFYLYMEGLFDPQKGKFTDSFLEKADLLESERPGGYRVSQQILDLAKTPERVVRQRWDENPANVRYTYLTQNFAIGYANGQYGAQDKMFAADLTGTQPLVSITLVPDVLDAPYGIEAFRDKSGHMKPVHLPLNLSAVQEKGTALLVADLNPMDALNSSSFATNMILPANASTILVDGEAVKVSASLHEEIKDGAVLGVRSGQSCFAARILSVDKLNGVAPIVELKADSAGLGRGALRLAIYHAQAAFTATDTKHLHVALLVEASDCKDDQGLAAEMQKLRAAGFQSAEKDGAWQGSVHVGLLGLELQENPATRLPASYTVNGHAVSSPVFDLNGDAMGLPAQAR